MITQSEFIAKYSGHQIPFQNCETGQCMALMHAYIAEVYGLTDPTILATPSASQVFTRIEQLNGSQYFTPITNTPNGIPNSGDIGVIGANEQGAFADGHVFIIISATLDKVTAFSQNWPTGAPAGIRTFSYVGLNWLTPKPQGEFVDTVELTKLRSEAPAFESFVQAGYNSPQDVSEKLQSLADKITALQKQNGDLVTKNEELLLEIKSNASVVTNAANTIEQQASVPSAAADQALNYSQQVKDLTYDMNYVATDLGTTYPPLKNITGEIDKLRNQLHSAKIELTKQAALNTMIQKGSLVLSKHKGFFSKLKSFIWVSKSSTS